MSKRRIDRHHLVFKPHRSGQACVSFYMSYFLTNKWFSLCCSTLLKPCCLSPLNATPLGLRLRSIRSRSWLLFVHSFLGGHNSRLTRHRKRSFANDVPKASTTRLCAVLTLWWLLTQGFSLFRMLKLSWLVRRPCLMSSKLRSRQAISSLLLSSA